MDARDLAHLRRCVELARAALAAGDEPYGSVLVGPDGRALAEDHNRVAGGDRTRHPELALARWAAEHLSPAERAASTVYTSGEHCPMCAAAHAWVGLGRIVYAASSAQVAAWLADAGLPPAPVRPLPVREVAPGVEVEGPVVGLDGLLVAPLAEQRVACPEEGALGEVRLALAVSALGGPLQCGTGALEVLASILAEPEVVLQLGRPRVVTESLLEGFFGGGVVARIEGRAALLVGIARPPAEEAEGEADHQTQRQDHVDRLDTRPWHAAHFRLQSVDRDRGDQSAGRAAMQRSLSSSSAARNRGIW